jgi:hypothetical protein
LRRIRSPHVSETPEQLYQRAAGALRIPPLQDWDTFPFAGEAILRPLEPPLDVEPPRMGTNGVECRSCERGDETRRRVHLCRWGDGAEHLHWWFMACPARLPQLRGSFAAIWDDILPPTPVDVWHANLDIVFAGLGDA